MSSVATASFPARTSVRGSPLTMVFESARSFWLNVSRAASTTARNVWKPASVGLTSNVTRVTPASRSTGCVATRVPSAKRRTVADCATEERISATASTDSPSRAVDGVVSRSTRTSSAFPRPIVRVSMRTPRLAASAASAWPEPVVSLPSLRSTIRFWASSGNSAVASRSAEPMSVADLTGADAIRSMSLSSDGSRSTRASLPNATIPATSPSGFSLSVSRRNARASSWPALPTESERSTTNTVASRSTGRTTWRPATANTSSPRSSARTMRAARRRPAPMRRRAARCRATVIASAGTRARSQSGVSNEMPI